MFSEVLKQLRTTTGISQVELAKALGVSQGNIGDWERGRTKPGYDALIALSAFFKVSADYLLLEKHEEISASSLSGSEIMLVNKYRKLSLHDQKEIIKIVDIKLENDFPPRSSTSNVGKTNTILKDETA